MYCLKRTSCKFWQLKKVECSLFTNFESIEPASNDYLIGSKDCPGDEKVSQSSYGQCVNKIKTRCEIFGFCLLLFCQNERTYLCSVCTLFGKSVFIFQFFYDKTYNYVLFNIINKAKFSRFDRTRGDKNQIFRTQDQCGTPAMMTSSARTIELRPLTQQQWSSLEVILEVC